MPFELTRDLLDNLSDLIKTGKDDEIKQLLKENHPADIAEIIAELNTEEAGHVYTLLNDDTAADVLIELDEDKRERLIQLVSSEKIARQFIENMDSDDAVDVISELDEDVREEVMQHIATIDESGHIVDLLTYDENTAGGLMAKELISVNLNWNVVKCLREMRKQAENINEVYFIYVVDDDNVLKGTLSLKRLLLSRNNALIKNLYNEDVIYVNVETPSEEVANIMEKYDLVALPVVDSVGRLVGRITIDDVVDFIREEAEKDYQMISGITEDIEASDTAWVITRARLPWLFIGLIGGIMVAMVLGNFEEVLKISPQMAFFIPLIGAMAGNVGIQSSSIIVQGIASNTLGLESTARKLFKEFIVALINGLILASLLFFYNYYFSDSFVLTITVSVSLFVVIIFAALFGTLIPLVLNSFKFDPALATGPFITTMNDIIAMLMYFFVGRTLYGII
ncbi:magnesium transporter [Bacteroidota bacterium]